MRRQGGGRIINFSDWVARSGRPALPRLPAVLRRQERASSRSPKRSRSSWRADNILVNAIAPGPIVAPPETTDEESQAVEQATPLGRWGGEQEIAKAVLALLDSDFITGETIRSRRRTPSEVIGHQASGFKLSQDLPGRERASAGESPADPDLHILRILAGHCEDHHLSARSAPAAIGSC